MKYSVFFMYLIVMAGVTYLIRMLPLVLVKKKIKNRFLLSFLFYVPYAVLSVMTIPAIFYCTSYIASAIIGLISALIMALNKKSLLTVAAVACGTVFISELLIKYLF